MNADQVKGEIKDPVGKVHEKAREAAGRKLQQAKGLEKQVEGKAEKALGYLKNAAKK